MKFDTIFCPVEAQAGLNEIVYEDCKPLKVVPKYRQKELAYYNTCAEIRPLYNQMNDSEKQSFDLLYEYSLKTNIVQGEDDPCQKKARAKEAEAEVIKGPKAPEKCKRDDYDKIRSKK